MTGTIQWVKGVGGDILQNVWKRKVVNPVINSWQKILGGVINTQEV